MDGRYARLTARLLGAFAAFIAVSNCSTEEPPIEATSWDSGLAPGCEAQLTDFVGAVHAAKTCMTAAECVFQPGMVPLLEWCCAGYTHAKAVDPYNAPPGEQSLKAREQAMKDCFQPLGCCFSQAPAPTCFRGKCWPEPAPEYGISQEACWGASDETACSECLCGACPAALVRCLEDAGCAKLLACARSKGCFGAYGCHLAAAGFPCKAVLAEVGGSTSEAANRFGSVDACRLGTGCFVTCQ